MEILFNTTQETMQVLGFSPNDCLYDICLANKIPSSSVSFYLEDFNGNFKTLVGIYKPIHSLVEENSRIIIQPNRNINYSSILEKTILIQQDNLASTEYTFCSSEKKDELHHLELSPSKCKEYVLEEVKSFLQKFPKIDKRPIIFGISGGGDSNTLLEAFINSGIIDKNQIYAVMCLGLPTWDDGKERALKLCNKFQIELHFITPQEICKLLNKRPDNDWFSGFEDVFNDTELAEVLGTLVVRLALQQKVRELGGQAMITGLNLEDLLAENLLSLMQGKLPMPFPIRTIDKIPLWYPLYRIPKKILDGCHPKFSLENYQQRANDKLQGRAVVYHLAQSLNSILPSSELDLIDGLQKLSETNDNYAFFDSELGFSVTEPLNKTLKDKWKYFTVY